MRRAPLLVFLLGCALPGPRDLQTLDGALEFDGILRTYHLHFPPKIDAGGPQDAPQFLVGRVCRDIDANQVIWDFFSKHPKP